ncbi:hypothetical protein Scep_016159 [Stephania cephalantha]|uniref:Uncharacterized protein n=1 Tax=Stephania cephalantha TaxID=152367 RepID=A0AAP0INT7_9MAGN
MDIDIAIIGSIFLGCGEGNLCEARTITVPALPRVAGQDFASCLALRGAKSGGFLAPPWRGIAGNGDPRPTCTLDTIKDKIGTWKYNHDECSQNISFFFDCWSGRLWKIFAAVQQFLQLILILSLGLDKAVFVDPSIERLGVHLIYKLFNSATIYEDEKQYRSVPFTLSYYHAISLDHFGFFLKIRCYGQRSIKVLAKAHMVYGKSIQSMHKDSIMAVKPRCTQETRKGNSTRSLNSKKEKIIAKHAFGAAEKECFHLYEVE